MRRVPPRVVTCQLTKIARLLLSWHPDLAFLVSNHFKNERKPGGREDKRGRGGSIASDVFSELIKKKQP